MAFFTGKNASFTIGSTAMKFTDWGLSLQVDIIDTTNFTVTNGRQTNEGGIEKATVTGSGPYTGSMATTVGTSGNFILNVGGSGPSFTIPARVSDISIKTSVRGVAECDITAESNGDYTITY